MNPFTELPSLKVRTEPLYISGLINFFFIVFKFLLGRDRMPVFVYGNITFKIKARRVNSLFHIVSPIFVSVTSVWWTNFTPRRWHWDPFNELKRHERSQRNKIFYFHWLYYFSHLHIFHDLVPVIILYMLYSQPIKIIRKLNGLYLKIYPTLHL